jgi:glycosyltransferase involved in cell wall biosynthesis
LHYFVTIGNFNKVKNQELLIQSFIQASILKTHRLVLIGDGPNLSQLKQKYAHSSGIIFEGYHSNVFKFLKAADAYVSASKSEGMPLSVLEAMSVHLPCILSDIPAHVELMQDNNPGTIKCFSLSKPQDLVDLLQNFKPAQHQYKFQTAASMTKAYEKVYQEMYFKNEPN